jgi:uncharacterized membrane protein
MRPGFTLHSAAVYLHVFSAFVALLLGPTQFSARMRRSHARLHRWAGRVYLSVGVVVGGASGLFLAGFAFGGPVSRLGFATLAVCWLYTGGRAFAAIRAGSVDEHREWMVRNFALTFAAVTLRLYVPLSVAAELDFAGAYAAIAWLCWVPNLLLAEWLFNDAAGRVLRRAA